MGHTTITHYLLYVCKGVYVWDVDGKNILTFYHLIRSQSALHPKLLMLWWADILTLTSRAFYNNTFLNMNSILRLLGYDKVLPMNTGVEGGETANKLARK